LLIVGLAPGMHGANATGRPFTGDFAGIMLYEALHAYGFASAAIASSADDGLILNNCRITNAVKCLPPENKPTAAEVAMCNQYLQTELTAMPKDGVILALGTIAHKAVVKALGLRQAGHAFAHGRHHVLSGKPHLLDSYHCSRYNTQTGRLTAQMFRDVFTKVEQTLWQ
jgi:uracil-DNA glycosylase family 4